MSWHRRKRSSSSAASTAASSGTSNLYPIVQDLTPVEYGQNCCSCDASLCNFRLSDLASAGIKPRKMSPTRKEVESNSRHRRRPSFLKRSKSKEDIPGKLVADPTETSTVSSIEETRGFMEQYVLTRRIARSLHSDIWECVHRQSGVRFCCKILERYTSEIGLFQAAQGPGVVPCYNVFMGDRKVHVIMQLVTGGNLLSRVVQQGSLEEATVRKMAWTIFQGLAGLESNGIVHNNLDPSNILLDGQDVPFICDFGSATNSLEPQMSQGPRKRPYTAPEVIRGHSPTAASDVYSAASVLYFCLFGSGPDSTLSFEGLPLSRRCKQFLTSCLHPDSEIRPTATEACNHPWFTEHENRVSPPSQPSQRKRLGVGRFLKGHHRNSGLGNAGISSTGKGEGETFYSNKPKISNLHQE